MCCRDRRCGVTSTFVFAAHSLTPAAVSSSYTQVSSLEHETCFVLLIRILLILALLAIVCWRKKLELPSEKMVYSYHPDTHEVQPFSKEYPCLMRDPNLSEFFLNDNTLYMLGGENHQVTTFNTLWQLDFATREWTQGAILFCFPFRKKKFF